MMQCNINAPFSDEELIWLNINPIGTELILFNNKFDK